MSHPDNPAPATPYLRIDLNRVEKNLSRLETYTKAHGIRVRPHTKTHKSVRLARRQLAHGCIGLTVAKVGEAQVMAELGADLLLAYPAIDPPRRQALAALARDLSVHCALDSVQAAQAVNDAAHEAGSTVGILVDLDVGMGRTGVQTPQQSLELARLVDGLPGLRLDGLFCYPGQVWNKSDQQGQALAAVEARLAETLDLWRAAGLEAKIVSAGSTPTAYQSHLMPSVTEIRPGTYIFNDMNTVHGGYCALDDCAATIIATVISTAVPGQVVLDSGSKTLTSDRCVPKPDSGHGHIIEYPGATISKLSEEHAQVDVSRCNASPKLGEQVTVIPNHICPCVNLEDVMWVDEGDGKLEAWRVDARGRLS